MRALPSRVAGGVEVQSPPLSFAARAKRRERKQRKRCGPRTPGLRPCSASRGTHALNHSYFVCKPLTWSSSSHPVFKLQAWYPFEVPCVVGYQGQAQHPASMTHSAYTPQERIAHGISEGLVRLSAGLEDEADLLQDVKAALDAALAHAR